eukprot:COSAG05_NODE_16999_length_334_cov_0.659574_1_plen_22_part_10
MGLFHTQQLQLRRQTLLEEAVH